MKLLINQLFMRDEKIDGVYQVRKRKKSTIKKRTQSTHLKLIEKNIKMSNNKADTITFSRILKAFFGSKLKKVEFNFSRKELFNFFI